MVSQTKKRLSDAETMAAIAEREAGVKVRPLARKYGVTSGHLDWVFLRNGVVSPDQVKRGIRRRNMEKRAAKRGDHMVYRFTPEEDVLIQRLSSEGVNNTEIGKSLFPPRKPNAILGRLLTLARHDEIQERRRDDGLAVEHDAVADNRRDPAVADDCLDLRHVGAPAHPAPLG